jgi:hypothetical protein
MKTRCRGTAAAAQRRAEEDAWGSIARATALHRKQIASRRSCCGLRVLARPL